MRTNTTSFDRKTPQFSIPAGTPEPSAPPPGASEETSQPGTRPRSDRNALPADCLVACGQEWVMEARGRSKSAQTVAMRRFVIEKLHWFATERGFSQVGRRELRAFLAYLNDDPPATGRWGDPRQTRPLRPSTAHTYFVRLKTFFAFLVAEEVLPSSPMEGMPAPMNRADQVQPFNPQQVQSLLFAASRTHRPLRDTALLRLMHDTGIRASEVCALLRGDVDMNTMTLRIRHGKGDKARTVPFGEETLSALWKHMNPNSHARRGKGSGRGREDLRGAHDPLFQSERGKSAGRALTRYGLSQLYERLGDAAGLTGVRCSPHTMRHTFAVEFLRAGGNVFALKEILGHTDLNMTNRYVALAQVDLSNAHRLYSPGDNLNGRLKDG